MYKLIITSLFSFILLFYGVSRAENTPIPSSSSSSSSNSYSIVPAGATARTQGRIVGEKYVIYGDENGTIVSHNMDTGKTQTIQAHTDRITCVSIARGLSMFVSSSADKTAKVWTLNKDDIWGSPEGWTLQHRSPVNNANFSSDGSSIITSTNAQKAVVFNKKFGTQQWTYSHTLGEKRTEDYEYSFMIISGHTDPVIYAAFSYDNSFAYTIQTDGTVRIWGHRGNETSTIIKNARSIFCGKNPYLFFVVTKTNTVEVVKYVEGFFYIEKPKTIATFQADSPIDFLYFNHDCSEIRALLSDGRTQIFSLDESEIQIPNSSYCSLS